MDEAAKNDTVLDPDDRRLPSFKEWQQSTFTTLRISGRRWFLLFLNGAFFGLTAYVLLVAYSYNNAAATMGTAGADFLRSWPQSSSNDSTVIATAILSQFNLNSTSGTLQGDLAKAITASAPATPYAPADLPIMDVATAFLIGHRPGACQMCNGNCKSILKPIMIRLLLGWPGPLDAEINALAPIPAPSGAPAPTSTQIDQACQNLSALSRSLGRQLTLRA
jgi:hypothetical protein